MPLEHRQSLPGSARGPLDRGVAAFVASTAEVGAQVFPKLGKRRNLIPVPLPQKHGGPDDCSHQQSRKREHAQPSLAAFADRQFHQPHRHLVWQSIPRIERRKRKRRLLMLCHSQNRILW
jgi:hypothetical protein